MGGDGGIPGRRKRPTGQQRPPGWNVGATGEGGGNTPPGPNNPPGTGTRAFGGRTGQTSGDEGSTGRQANLDILAPLPDRPSLYPTDSTYFLVPVTFEIELLTRPEAPAPKQTAAGVSRRKGVGS